MLFLSAAHVIFPHFLIRFGKKKEDKSSKGDPKGHSKHGALKEEDLAKMKSEQER